MSIGPRSRQLCAVSRRTIGGNAWELWAHLHAKDGPAAVKAKAKAAPRDGAHLLSYQLTAMGIAHEREVELIDGRKFRWDIVLRQAVPPLAVEVNGWGGGHQNFVGQRRDAEKSALLAILKWRGMSVTTDDVKSGRAAKWIQAALGGNIC